MEILYSNTTSGVVVAKTPKKQCTLGMGFRWDFVGFRWDFVGI